jgi:hypothetical protein
MYINHFLSNDNVTKDFQEPRSSMALLGLLYEDNQASDPPSPYVVTIELSNPIHLIL